MNTKTMIFGGSAALALLIGVAFFAVATETNEGTMLGETALGDMLRKGMDNGKGEVERAMDGDCDQAEKDRDQLKNGSCSEGPSDESGEMKQERSQGANAPEEAKQVREQLQDGSCGNETGEMKQNRTGDLYQVREREQIRNQTCEPIQNRTGDASQVREREQLRNESCGNETGEMKQNRTGDASKGSEQVREQKKDGSCDDDASEDEYVVISSTSDAGDESKDRSGIQQHDRDRDQDNGGTGPEYRNGAV